MEKLSIFLFIISLLLTFALFVIYLPYQPFDDFCFSNLIDATMMLAKLNYKSIGIKGFYILHAIEFYHRFVPHVTIAMLSCLTSLSCDTFVFIPLPIFISFLSLMLILDVLTNLTKYYKFLFTLLFVGTLSMSFLYHFYYISLAFSIFLLFIYKVYKYSYEKELNIVIILTLLFIAIVFSHYTFAMLAIIIKLLHDILSRKLRLSIFFIILFISIELVIYTQTAVETAMIYIFYTPISQMVSVIYNYLSNLLFTSIQHTMYARYNPYFTNIVTQLSGSLSRFLTIIYFLLSFLYLLYYVNLKNIFKKVEFKFIVMLFIAGVFEIIIYILAGFGDVIHRSTFLAQIILMAFICPVNYIKSFKSKKDNTTITIFNFIITFILTSLVFVNFLRAISFSFEYGIDYNNYYFKANFVSSYFITYGDGVVTADHYTSAIISYHAIRSNIQKSLSINVIYTDINVTESNFGYYIIPFVKGMRAGWFGYIPSEPFHSFFLTYRNLYFDSGFFKVYG